MSDIILFGGTTEGRLLAQYCADHRIRAVVCVVSEYGHQVLPVSPYLCVQTKAMEEEGMTELIRKEGPAVVLDATHPYASVVTENILRACEKTGAVYKRVSREEGKAALDDRQNQVLWVDSAEEAVRYLSETEGKILVTTGSRELQAYTKIPGYEDRIYVRVLPGEDILAQCRSYGIGGRHVLAMQGPFSMEMNLAMLRHVGAGYLVTKDAGTAGGFMEKIEAALAAQVQAVVIGRPWKPEGMSVEEAKRLLDGIRGEREPEAEQEKSKAGQQRSLTLIGIGMGGSRQLTMEAAECLRSSDAVLGAARMLESIWDLAPGARKVSCYLSRDVMAWLQDHQAYRRVSVVYSGDTGFYSGAGGLLEEIRRAGEGFGYETEVLPGISTVSYLCAKLKTSWEDAYLASIHGREADVCGLMKAYKKVFLLLGGEDSVRALCRRLTAGGYGYVTVSVGQRLSYPDEQVMTGRAVDWTEASFDSLAAVLIRQEGDLRSHD